MSFARLVRSLWIALPLLLALAALSLAPQPAAPGASVAAGNAIALKPPPFVQPAYAQEGTDTATAADAAAAPLGFPQDEAGIAAYFKSATPVNLADVRSVYRVIEAQTADYIIGSVPVPNYPESFDVHVYVHNSGWFLAYYLAEDPVGKIYDWFRYASGTRSTIPTILETVLGVVTATVGVSLPGVTYYDFRYPNATHLMLIAEDTAGGHDFYIRLPSTNIYYHRSWTILCTDSWWGSDWWLNGNRVAGSLTQDTSRPIAGTLTVAQLTPDTNHYIEIGGRGFGGLALIYRVP